MSPSSPSDGAMRVSVTTTGSAGRLPGSIQPTASRSALTRRLRAAQCSRALSPRPVRRGTVTATLGAWLRPAASLVRAAGRSAVGAGTPTTAPAHTAPGRAQPSRGRPSAIGCRSPAVASSRMSRSSFLRSEGERRRAPRRPPCRPHWSKSTLPTDPVESRPVPDEVPNPFFHSPEPVANQSHLHLLALDPSGPSLSLERKLGPSRCPVTSQRPDSLLDAHGAVFAAVFPCFRAFLTVGLRDTSRCGYVPPAGASRSAYPLRAFISSACTGINPARACRSLASSPTRSLMQ